MRILVSLLSLNVLINYILNKNDMQKKGATAYALKLDYISEQIELVEVIVSKSTH